MPDPAARLVHLADLDLAPMIQGWRLPVRDRSIMGTPLTIGGRSFARGVGTHTISQCFVRLAGGCTRFTAWVGVDDVVGLGQARFVVRGDGRTLFDSGVMNGTEAARPVDVDLRGVDLLELFVDAPGDRTHHGHADWAEAVFAVTGVAPETCRRPSPPAILLGGEASPEPRLGAPRVLGVRPGSPLCWRIPSSGTPAPELSADGLPPGVRLDAARRALVGAVERPGRWTVRLAASGPHGSDRAELELVAGDTWQLTPPMGWNSWNGFAHQVSADDVLRAAHALVEHGLADAGWRFVTIDDGWQGVRSPRSAIPMALQPNARFPDMAGLVRDINALGLQAGLYSVVKVHSPQGLTGGSADHADGRVDGAFSHGSGSYTGAHRFIAQDIRQYAAWGFDYLKVDCHPSADEIAELRAAIDGCGRDLVLSLSAGYTPDEIRALARPGGGYRAHAWRTTGDLIDTWFNLRGKIRANAGWHDLAGPGAWNDPDMLVVGHVGPGWEAPPQPTRLSPDEQYLHVTLWALLAGPLMIGCDLTRLDPFTRHLLCNRELIACHQDALGRAARRAWQDVEAASEAWVKPLADGGAAVALVNLADEPRPIAVAFAEIGLPGSWRVRDLWRRGELSAATARWSDTVPAHGVLALRLSAA